MKVPNPTTKRHAVVSSHLNTVTCPTYPEKFILDNVVAPCLQLSVVIVTHFSSNKLAQNSHCTFII